MNSREKSDVVINGLNRFLTEGYSVWSKDKFKALLKTDPKVSEELIVNDLIKRGFIRYVGDEDEYIVVLKEIE